MSHPSRSSEQQEALTAARKQLEKACSAKKCHPCGCLRDTITALKATPLGEGVLSHVLAEIDPVIAPQKYDCLGCEVCYPAIAVNALQDAFPELSLVLEPCPTDVSKPRVGWPPLPGNYKVIRYQAPVAVCVLNSPDSAEKLARNPSNALSIVGSLHTENLGIERIVQNILTNPNIRFLLVCGEDTKQAVGHLPGQSLLSLLENGIDEKARIVGARGKRPVLKNLTLEQIEAFRCQIEAVSLIGETRESILVEEIDRCAERNPGPLESLVLPSPVDQICAREPTRLVMDPAGYFVIYPDPSRQSLTVEHYTNDGVLDKVIEGDSPAALWSTVIEKNLITRLDHAAYLGRELALADKSLRTGEPYVQDRAPGETEFPSEASGTQCNSC